MLEVIIQDAKFNREKSCQGRLDIGKGDIVISLHMIQVLYMQSSRLEPEKLYTLMEILRSLDESYILKIERKCMKQPWNKKALDSTITEFRLRKIYEKLTDPSYFSQNINNTYSSDTRLFRIVSSTGGTTEASRVKGIEASTELIPESIENIQVFAVPSPKAPDFYAVPSEYILLADSRSTNYYYNYTPDKLTSCILNYDQEFLNLLAKSYSMEPVEKSLEGIAKLYATISNSFTDILSALSNQENKTLKEIYDNFGAVSYNNLLGAEDRYYGVTSSAFLNLLNGRKMEGPYSLLTKGVTALVCASNGNTKGLVILSPEFTAKMAMHLKPGNNFTNSKKVVPLVRSESAYEKFVSIMIAGEFLEIEGKKHDEEKISKVTNIAKPTVEAILGVSRINRLIDGPRTRFHLTDEGKSLLDGQQSTREYFLRLLESTSNLERDPEDSYSERKLPGNFFSVVDKVLAELQLLRVSQIVQTAIDHTVIYDECRNIVIAAINEASYYSYRKNYNELLKSPRVYFKNLMTNKLIDRLSILYLAGKISVSSEDINPETYVLSSNQAALGADQTASLIKTDKNSRMQASLLPNYEILFDPYLPFDEIEFIASLSELISIDRVIVARLTKTSLVRYLNKYGSSDGIIKRLSEIFKSEIPQNVLSLVKDVSGKEDEVSLIPSQYVLVVRDPSIIEDLKKNKVIERYIGDRISDNAVIVKHGISKEKLINAVKKRGYVVQMKSVSDIEDRDAKQKMRK